MTTPAINVAGKCKVRTDIGAGLVDLGFSINGVQIIERPFFANIPGDENGGDEGPPVDKQFMGELHYIRLEMSKWDDTVMAAIRAKLKGNTEASSFTPGSLVIAGSFFFRLLLIANNFTRNYLVAVPSEPFEMNAGTRWSRAVIEFECHRVPWTAGSNAGVMWNAVTS